VLLVSGVFNLNALQFDLLVLSLAFVTSSVERQLICSSVLLLMRLLIFNKVARAQLRRVR